MRSGGDGEWWGWGVVRMGSSGVGGDWQGDRVGGYYQEPITRVMGSW